MFISIFIPLFRLSASEELILSKVEKRCNKRTNRKYSYQRYFPSTQAFWICNYGHGYACLWLDKWRTILFLVRVKSVICQTLWSFQGEDEILIFVSVPFCLEQPLFMAENSRWISSINSSRVLLFIYQISRTWVARFIFSRCNWCFDSLWVKYCIHSVRYLVMINLTRLKLIAISYGIFIDF